MMDKALIAALRLVPKNALSRLAGEASRLAAPKEVRLAAMRAFAWRYRVNLDECAPLESYATFEEFFTRPLNPGARPIAPGDDVVVSPVDGVVSQLGTSGGGRLVQAKGRDYALAELVRDDALAKKLEGGPYVTLYLSPRDYHRIHYPLPGAVAGYRYAPGQLWPVNPASVENVPNLFAVNERLVTILDTPLGTCAVVAVGATIVGRIRAYYDPTLKPSNQQQARAAGHDYAPPIPAEKGGELGAFELGSTVILCFERGRVAFDADLAEGAAVKVGQPIGGPG